LETVQETVQEPVAEPVAELASEAAAEPEQAAPAPAPVAAAAEAAAPVQASTETAPIQVESLREVLSAAGLTLAVTDPDKLRMAQEAAAKQVPSPHVPRERKPLPPTSTEPLVQVETRR
jgi:ribonuclease E